MIYAKDNWYLNSAWKRLCDLLNINSKRELKLITYEHNIDKAFIIYFRGLCLINNELYLKGFSKDYNMKFNVFITNIDKYIDIGKWEECDFGEIRIKSWFNEKGENFPVYQHICHRGNVFLQNTDNENKPDVLDMCDSNGFYVECDVWLVNENELWLGHDNPEYKVDLEWLSRSHRRLIHAKDGATFAYLINESAKAGLDLNVFYHTVEDYALSTKGWIIVHPNRPLVEGSICMMPEMTNPYYSIDERKKLFFLCSDRSDGFTFYFSNKSS